MIYKDLNLLITVIVLLLLFPCLSGQSYVLTHYTSRDGIAHDNIRDMTIDGAGFLWLATWDGLTRFDGSEFKNYFHNPGDTTSLPYFSVNMITVDRLENIWITTDSRQVACFDRVTEQFKVVETLDNHSLESLISLKSDNDGNIIFALNDKILKYDPGTGKTREFAFPKDVFLEPRLYFSIYQLLIEDDDHLWLAGPEVVEIQLESHDSAEKDTARIISINKIIKNDLSVIGLFEFRTDFHICRDTSGNAWLASNIGLFRHDRESAVFSGFEGNINDIGLVTGKPLTYFDDQQGLKILLPEADSVITIPGAVCGLPVRILSQSSDLLWYSSFSPKGTPAGLTRVVITPNEFRLINPYPDSSRELNVYGITKDAEGGLWIAARDKDHLIRITRDGVVQQINTLTSDDLSEAGHPRALLPDSGGIWAAYFFRKLVYYELSTGKVKIHSPDAIQLHTICSDGNGRFIISDGGLKRYDPATGKTETLVTIDPDSVNFFTIYRNGNIVWAGGSHCHLLRYDLETMDYRLIRLADQLSNIEDICPGSGNDLWIAMLGSGVCRFDTVSGERTFYTTSSGLSNNTTYSLLIDRQHNVWVSTNSGISVINAESGLIRSFGQNDGLAIHEFNSDALFESEDGTFYFGGVGGVVQFAPDQILNSVLEETKSDILILELETSGRKKLSVTDPLFEADTLLFDKGENNFHISFVTPEFRYPEKIRYRYWLSGVSDEWSHTDHKDRNINYSNLKPGWYTLTIEATDLNGSWASSKNISIYITPWFYQTLLFRIAVPLVLLGLLAALAYSLVRQFKLREKQKQDNLRHQALRGQMNPHFIFNSLNSINYFISNNDKLSANRYIADFSKLIRSVLNNMNEDYVTLDMEVESIEDYLKIEHLRFGDKFDYSLNIDDEIDLKTLKVSPGLVQPFIENAIWHGVRGLENRKGRIEIRFRMVNGKLVCTVEDDGIGRSRADAMKDKSHRRRSRGIEMALERLHLINSIHSGSFQVKITDLFPGGDETGTKVEIDLPIQKN